jgi:RHH-type proline utilization regulon transcriptional repressor/proline dehydrogenase/delta 1-pyrroline-5-carboxylate dehydrogenase
MDQLDIEMLEGMANPEALAIANRKLRILLLTPLVLAVMSQMQYLQNEIAAG